MQAQEGEKEVMFWSKRPSEDKESEERKARQAACPHIDFMMFGSNVIGEATCLSCGYTTTMNVFFNLLVNRLRDLERRLEKQVK